MDRRRALARLLIAAAAGLLIAGGARAPDLPIREARWLPAGALLEGLSREPAECLVLPSDADERHAAAIGKIAFRAPLLLGGQAARAGLSCASCHSNGRGNPQFLFPGISGAAGTADVTASLMSRHRGDGTHNPRPIPDLAGPPEKRIVSHERSSRALETFIRGLIVEEFDGPEPPPAVLDGIAAYVRAIRAEGCKGDGVPITLRRRLDEVEAAMALAAQADPETRRLLVAAARSTLGAIDERFRLPGLERSRSVLRITDAELRQIRAGAINISAWLHRWPERRRLLEAQARRSLFSPEMLRRRIARSAR